MSSAIRTYPLNGITYTAEEAAGYHSARTSGVYCLDEDFKVSLPGGLFGAARSVQISPGRAWVHPDRFTGYSIIMREPVTLALSPPSSFYTRTDCVVLRFDRSARRSYLTVLVGEETSAFSSKAPAPGIIRNSGVYDLCLAEIRYPTLSRKNTILIDTRGDESRCGLMRDGVTRIPELTIGTVTTGETASATIKNGVLNLVLPNGNGGSSTGGISAEEKQALLEVLRLLAAGNDTAMDAYDRLAALWGTTQPEKPDPPTDAASAVLGQAVLGKMILGRNK